MMVFFIGKKWYNRLKFTWFKPNYKIIFLIVLQFLIVKFSYSQINFQSGYFRSPVDMLFSISSNFGEIRPNHFHAGLDVSTGARPGKYLFAVANGYISRIKVSPRGYGNAIYITHPNGYVSVYCHMNEFNKKVRDYIFKVQHNRQQFEIDIYPSPALFPLKKGDFIGKVGNTGSSYGAHLHFEIREEESEKPVNALYVYNVKDNVAPKINGVYIYEFGNNHGNNRYINHRVYKKIDGKTIQAFGTLGFGLEIHDYITGKKRTRFGVYQVKLLIDDSLCFAYKMEKFSFDESRYINSFIDYQERIRSGKKVTKCFIEPNNKLSIYQTNGSGLFDFSDGKLHTINIIGRDIKGNTASVKFYVQSDGTKVIEDPVMTGSIVKTIDCTKADSFVTNSFKVFFPENSLYHNIDLKYRTSTNLIGGYSKLYHLQDQYTPIHDDISISIKPDDIPLEYKSKAVIAGFSRYSGAYSVGGTWNNEYLETQINYFGTFFVTVDTIPPLIKPLSFDPENTLNNGTLKFEISDDLSGIQEYIGYIDDKWVLFEYDEKNDLISCDLEREGFEGGELNLVLWVKDNCGNISSYENCFNY